MHIKEHDEITYYYLVGKDGCWYEVSNTHTSLKMETHTNNRTIHECFDNVVLPA